MKQKHTPGPYDCEIAYATPKDVPFAPELRVLTIMSPTGDICYMANGGGQGDGEASELMATAKFIVRACNAHDDLVAALEDILICEKNRRADLATLSKKPRSIYEFSDMRIKRAEAALKKSRGENA